MDFPEPQRYANGSQQCKEASPASSIKGGRCADRRLAGFSPHAVENLGSCWRSSSRDQGYPSSPEGRFGDERIRQIEFRGHPSGSKGDEPEVVGQRFATNRFATSRSEAERGERQCGLSPVLALIDGERGRNRTYNLLIKSQLLCQLSYAPSVTYSANAGDCSRKLYSVEASITARRVSVNSGPLRGDSNRPGDATIAELRAAIEREAEKRTKWCA